MQLVEQLAALELISRLPDDLWLTTEEAAIFLRVSKSSLEKMRRPNYPVQGPTYSQGGRKGARGDNQKILYKKSDLKDWLESNKVSSIHEAAVRKGQMFATIHDVVSPQAFWMNPRGNLAGLVEKTAVDAFFERLGDWEIVWLPAMEAVEKPWEKSSIAALKVMANEVRSTIESSCFSMKAAVERAAVGVVVDEQQQGPRSGRM